jgi:hypothetical protein
MQNWAKEIYFMEEHRHDMMREAENERRARLAIAGNPHSRPGNLRQWVNLLSQVRKIRIEVSFEIKKPQPEC